MGAGEASQRSSSKSWSSGSGIGKVSGGVPGPVSKRSVGGCGDAGGTSWGSGTSANDMSGSAEMEW